MVYQLGELVQRFAAELLGPVVVGWLHSDRVELTDTRTIRATASHNTDGRRDQIAG